MLKFKKECDFFARSRRPRDDAEAYEQYAAQGVLTGNAEVAEKEHSYEK
jgi:hypothetical protein